MRDDFAEQAETKPEDTAGTDTKTKGRKSGTAKTKKADKKPRKKPAEKTAVSETSDERAAKTPPDNGGKEAASEDSHTDNEVRAALLAIPKKPISPLARFFQKGGMPNLILVLTTICVCVAVLLAAVYAVTDPRIQAEKERAMNEALNLVFAESLEFRLSPYDGRVYEGRDTSGALKGFAVRVSPQGYGGPIDMVVGLDLGVAVTGVNIVSHRETKGYGTKMQTEPWFLEQFAGKTDDFALGKGVDGISGATRSSAAAVAGVKEAADIIMDLVQSGKGG